MPAMISRVTIQGSVQPLLLLWFRASSRVKKPMEESTIPLASNFSPLIRLVSPSSLAISNSSIIPIGRLMEKITRQSIFCTRYPPNIGPIAGAAIAAIPQIPITVPMRSLGHIL